MALQQGRAPAQDYFFILLLPAPSEFLTVTVHSHKAWLTALPVPSVCFFTNACNHKYAQINFYCNYSCPHKLILFLLPIHNKYMVSYCTVLTQQDACKSVIMFFTVYIIYLYIVVCILRCRSVHHHTVVDRISMCQSMSGASGMEELKDVGCSSMVKLPIPARFWLGPMGSQSQCSPLQQGPTWIRGS